VTIVKATITQNRAVRVWKIIQKLFPHWWLDGWQFHTQQTAAGHANSNFMHGWPTALLEVDFIAQFHLVKVDSGMQVIVSRQKLTFPTPWCLL